MTLIFVSTFILSSFLPFASPTKVSDGAVWTSPRETFWKGQKDRSLNCSFQGSPISVGWWEGETLQTAKPIIKWYKGETTKEKGEGFEFGPNFSLLFHHPNTSDTGRYFCRVSKHQDIFKSNHTDLRVLVYDNKNYVTIKLCEHLTNLNQSEDLRDTPCTYDVPDNQTSFQLNCSVSGALPKVSLTWVTNGTNVGTHYNMMSMSEDHGDGTFDQTVTMAGSVNETRNGTVFTCIAEGLSVGGLANSSVIFVKTESHNDQPNTPDTTQKPHVAAIVVPIIVCLVLLAAIVGYVWKGRNKQETTQTNESGEQEGSRLAL